MSPDPERERLFTRAFAALWFVAFFQELSYGLMIHLPGYLERLGATESRIGLVYAFGAVVALLLRPVMGRVIDQWGRKRVMLSGGLVLAAASAAYIPLSTFGPPVFLVRMLYTSVEIMLFTTVLALGADVVPRSRRSEGLGLLGISGLLPIGLGSILGDVVLGQGSFARLFAISAALALVSWTLAWTLPDLASADPHRRRHRGFRPVLGQRDLRPVWLVSASFALGMITLFTYLRTYVDTTGTGSVGLYFGAYAAVAVVVRVFGRSLADRAGPVRMLIPALGAYALQFVLLGAAGSSALMVVAGMVGGFGHGLVFPILTTLVVDRASQEERGTALAVFSGLFDVVVLAGAPPVGVLIESAGYGPAFVVVGGAVAALLAGFLLWDRRVAPEVDATTPTTIPTHRVHRPG